MSDPKELDLSDPQIRTMVDRNHVPQEQWTGGGQLFDVTCEKCGNRWPCPTRQKLDSTRRTPPPGSFEDDVLAADAVNARAGRKP